MIRMKYLQKPQGRTWTETIKTTPEPNHFAQGGGGVALCQSHTASVAQTTNAEGEQSCGQGKQASEKEMNCK